MNKQHRDSLLSSTIVVLHEPVHSLLDALLHGSELVVRKVLSQLRVGSGLLVLTVRLRAVVLHIIHRPTPPTTMLW